MFRIQPAAQNAYSDTKNSFLGPFIELISKSYVVLAIDDYIQQC